MVSSDALVFTLSCHLEKLNIIIIIEYDYRKAICVKD